ncbi:MAG: 3-hydroxyacyl-CoA dehydrogenase NAD-binding domain-containing protein [Armatimonadota bacterium]|nr:3-hydroxyacyl-CoA dehydrogenase NAD-binding domain-containing protein [Armatimonadota bacterium]MDR7423437.1 3-hydroxyacyl-CoA dehydrogenase NAD-binding domain-containing protein [Armatimonadota bacterium]MDR7453633.1 3-hydroxyacyl-CoA dehydrogenase NAD-binding domain-containing protein [Armatimonadota bacterium]MDR7457607.1 3-hydroxyacyl-CoA dehydrogenase NAD-binding domain-containing protein [Armatimonadota bacterium]MDR7495482.1 3-hydroxyacyl-CoA dehydrogenase NAD-binding domain-containin
MNGDDVRTVALIGAGTMGPGMAAMFATHGFDVRLADIKPDVLERARGTVETVYATLQQGELLSADQVAAARPRLTFTSDPMDALAGVDFVVEAIPERADLKQQFFAEAERRIGPEAILASNTSGIPITELGRAVQRPERVVGMHWSNPPHLIPVIEVIRGERTGDAAVAATRRVVERLGMIPVVVRRDVPGFVENRILYAIMREALHLLEEGIASAEDIDTIVKWGIGYKLAVIGPLELLDVAGLDIYHSVASYLNADLSSRRDVSPLVRQKVEAGELGIKTGRGLFAYTPESIPPLMQRRMRLLLATRKALSVTA